MVGSDPRRFKELADSAAMPDSPQKMGCADYGNAAWSWETATKTYRRDRLDDSPFLSSQRMSGVAEDDLPGSPAARELGFLDTDRLQASH
jgi:hypothetical protein